jgi:hypothetical protein
VALQTGRNYLVNFKVEGTEGTAATGGASTGERLRTLASPGLKLARAGIMSEEVRNDANKSMMRLGSKSVAGSYLAEWNLSSFDTLVEAFFRSTWVAPVAITFDGGAALTSLTVNSSSQITFAGTTTPAAAGLRVGDVFRLTNMSTAANNSVNCRVLSIAGSVVNLVGTPLTTQTADSACTLTIGKKLIQATTPTRRTFTVEQHLEDADYSELFVGVRVVSLSLEFQPGRMARATFGFVGLDRSPLSGGSAPYFTSPTEYTTINLIADDAALTYNGAVITQLTGATLNFSIDASGQPVLGSLVSPGTFDNDLTAGGQVSRVFDSSADLTLFDAETEFEASFLLTEPESEPKSYYAFFFPRVKIADIETPLGSDAAMIRTNTVSFGPKVAATGYDAGVITICTAA